MTNQRFFVTIPKYLIWLAISFCIFILVIPLAIMLCQHTLKPVLLLFIFIFDIPFIFAAFWTKNYRIDVESNQITVHRALGGRFSFVTMDIQKVIRRINHTQAGTIEKITIYVPKHKISVEEMMIGFPQMKEYIQDYVPRAKIIIQENTFFDPND